MLFASVAETSRRVAGTSKRLEKVELLAQHLRALQPEEVEIVAAFLSGNTLQGRTGIGYGSLREANVAPAAAPELNVLDVHRALDEIGVVSGSGSQRRRVELLRQLFGRATALEQDFLRNLLSGELRQGAIEGVLVDALIQASGISAQRVRRAVMMAGDIAPVARAALEHGEAGLDQFEIRLFRPIQPMLAGSAEDAAEAIAELGEAALEYKLDGARVQIHRAGGDVAVYTRGLNEVTGAVPEIVESVLALPATELILDGEVLCLTPEGRPQPFQVSMRRFGRKLDVERMRAELPMTPFWFDLLYLDGGHLLDEPQSRRFAELARLAPGAVIPSAAAANAEQAEAFLERAILEGHEGLMAKDPASPYAAGARGQSWLKVKRARTLDLVILAAEWGSGRRSGWLSNLHLGARDTGKGGFAMLGKTFKGLTDEMLAWQTQELLKIEIGRDGHTVFVEPKLVAEIAFNEIQISTRYASGLALRFARVKRYRTDKRAEDADTFQTVQRMAGVA